MHTIEVSEAQLNLRLLPTGGAHGFTDVQPSGWFVPVILGALLLSMRMSCGPSVLASTGDAMCMFA